MAGLDGSGRAGEENLRALQAHPACLILNLQGGFSTDLVEAALRIVDWDLDYLDLIEPLHRVPRKWP